MDAGLRTVYTLPPNMTGAQTVAFGTAEGGARAIAVSRGDDVDIWALPLEPTTHAVTGPAAPRAKSTSVERHPNLSPDGRRLAFVSNRSGRLALWVAAADGSSPQQLSDLDADVTGFPRWSPDSRWIAFHASAPNQERQIYLVDVAEGSPVLLAGGCCPAGWSHDGRYLYSTAVGNISYVQRMRVADGAKERLFEGEFAIESADGERLLYAKPPERGVFARALAGSPGVNREEQLVDDYVPDMDSWYGDLQNAGTAEGSLVKSGLFIREFVTRPWVHLDIGGTGYFRKPLPFASRGANGVTHATLVELALAGAG